jgi:hypothetical protein
MRETRGLSVIQDVDIASSACFSLPPTSTTSSSSPYFKRHSPAGAAADDQIVRAESHHLRTEYYQRERKRCILLLVGRHTLVRLTMRYISQICVYRWDQLRGAWSLPHAMPLQRLGGSRRGVIDTGGDERYFTCQCCVMQSLNCQFEGSVLYCGLLARRVDNS